MRKWKNLMRLETGSDEQRPFLFAGGDEGEPGEGSLTDWPDRSIEDPTQVLIVEDDYLIAALAEETLSAAGYVLLTTATTAAEAIRTAVSEKPDIILMDIRLAGARDGIFAAGQILDQTGIRCIFTTAHTDAATRDRAAATRPLGWLPKPYHQSDLVRAIEDAVNRAGKH
jgi:CheY-like chemotaxis protein